MRKAFFSVLMLLTAFCANGQNIDPFYTSLYSTGLAKMKISSYEDAYRDIRVASFGFMDNERMLAESYIALLVISFRLEDIAGIENFYSKLQDMDYSSHAQGIDPYLRREFEDFLKWNKNRDKKEDEIASPEVIEAKPRKEELLEKKKNEGLNLTELEELAYIYRFEKNYKELYRLLDPISQAIQDRPALLLLLGESQYERKKYTKSRKTLEKYAELAKDRDDAYFWVMAQLDSRDREWDRARDMMKAIKDTARFDGYDELLDKIEANTEVQTAVEHDEAGTEIAMDTEDYQAVIDRLEKSPIPDNPEYAFMLAGAYFQKQRFSDCIETVKKMDIAQLEEKDRVKAYYYLGVCHVSINESREGCKYLETAYRGREMLGKMEAENLIRNMTEGECLSYADIVREYNRDRENHLNILTIALAEYKNRRYEQAIRYFSRIRERDPDHLYANYYLGICNYYLGRHKESIAYYELLVEKGHRFAALFYRLGSSYYATGEYALAYQYLGRIYRLYEDNEAFLRMYRDAESRVKG